MKSKVLQLVLFVSILVLLACASSENDFYSESLSTIEQPVPFTMKFHDLIQQVTVKLNDNALFKNENNGNGIKIVAFYLDDGFWLADFPIYNKRGETTQILTIAFPQDGVDRALLFSETDMMVNFTSQDPRLFIWDTATKAVVYSNWCEEDRSGFYKGRGKTGYVNPDWTPKAFFWGPFAPVQGDDNYIFNIKATLYPASGKIEEHGMVCKYSPLSESVAISYTFQGQNGRIRQTYDMQAYPK